MFSLRRVNLLKKFLNGIYRYLVKRFPKLKFLQKKCTIYTEKKMALLQTDLLGEPFFALNSAPLAKRFSIFLFFGHSSPGNQFLETASQQSCFGSLFFSWCSTSLRSFTCRVALTCPCHDNLSCLLL